MSNHLNPDRRDVMMGMLAAVAVGCTPSSDKSTSGDTDVIEPLDTDGLVAWATGGTAAMGASYPITFGSECAQTCELTLGPCYVASIARADISENVMGLPTRMALRVVDADCKPVPGAVVDVWHCAPNGLYSGKDAIDFCTDGNAQARASAWFRGEQTTDDDGVATFDTCLPGWYPGRAVHIHAQVRIGDDSYVITQVAFPADLLADVYANHPDYTARGQADTPNTGDNVFKDDTASYLFAWSQADDGVLVVWKTLTLRNSLDDATC